MSKQNRTTSPMTRLLFIAFGYVTMGYLSLI